MKNILKQFRFLQETDIYFLIVNLAFVFFIPLYQKVIPVLIWIWMIFWLLAERYSKNKSPFRFEIAGILLIVFYLLHIVGLIYTKNLGEGLFDIQVKLSLIIFPLFLPRYKHNLLNNLDKILLWFVLGVIVSIIICAGIMLNDYVNNPDSFNYFKGYPLYLLYSRFSFFHHTSYFTLFLVFSVAVLFYFIRTKRNNFRRNFFFITLIGIISALTIGLLSRAGIIGLFIVLIWNIIPALQKKPWWLSVSIIVLVLALPLITFTRSDRFSRFITKAPYKEIFQEEIKNVDNNSFERIYIWHSAVKVIKQNWFFGVGTGDVKDNMKSIFRKNGFVHGVKRNYNAHNQFLETWAGLGIIGEIILLAILIYGLAKGIRNKDILLQSFIILIFVHFFFESMLNRLAGIIFFSYFYSLLLYRNNIKT